MSDASHRRQTEATPVKVLRMITRLNIGGPSLHAALLSTKLNAERFSTCLVVGEPDATEGDLSGLITTSHTRVIRVKTLRRPVRPFMDLLTLVRLARIVWQERPRLIHTHMAKAGALGRMTGLLYNRFGPGHQPGQRARLLHTFHGHVLEGYFPRWQTRIFLAIERWLGRRTDCLIAVNDSVRQDLLRLGVGSPERIEVVPLGLDLEPLLRLSASPSGDGVRLGIVGRLVPIKNHTLFLKGIAQLLRDRPCPFRCRVIGDGFLRSSLERQNRAMGLESVVTFVGWEPDRLAIYRDVDVICLTSKNEGTPVALIEALAAARAVIATDVGGVRELLGRVREPSSAVQRRFTILERGVVVPPGDVEGFAQGLACLLTNPRLREAIGATGRSFVQKRFAFAGLERAIDTLYGRLLNNQGERVG